MDIQWIASSGVETSTAIYFLLGMASTILLMIYLTYRYQRYKRFQEFQEEMETLELGEVEESTLCEMVKRFSLQEPVQVLLSKRVFDEMAAREINRVLGSPGSMKAKETFVNLVYEIRKKTYHKDWSEPLSLEGLVEKQADSQSEEETIRTAFLAS